MHLLLLMLVYGVSFLVGVALGASGSALLTWFWSDTDEDPPWGAFVAFNLCLLWVGLLLA